MSRLLIAAMLSAASLCAFAQKTVPVNAGDIAPLSYLEEGVPAGLAVDILNAASKLGKYKFEISVVPWMRAQSDTQASSSSGITPLTRTAEREPKYTWIAELFQQNLVFVTTGSTPAPKSLADASKLTVGVLKGSQAVAVLQAAGIKVDAAAEELQNAKKLRLGRIDAWVVSEFVAPLRWEEAGGKRKDLQIGSRVGDPAKVYFAAGPGFSKQDAEAIGADIEALRKNGSIDKIVSKYRVLP